MGPRGGRVFFFNLNNSFDPAFALRAQTAHRVSLCLRGLATKGGGGGRGGVEDTYRTHMGLEARSLKKLYVFRKRMARPNSFITFRKL